ncbi:MAG TPA: M36 family metallopeptidase [Kofleriaceae bacterium]|nr:M36 family metallopeptidase [Kofleriaceae bacterium]
MACATSGLDDGAKLDPGIQDRDSAVLELGQLAGAPVTVELSETGGTRVLSATPRFPIPGHSADVATAAVNFLTANHAAFQLEANDASSFVVTRVDSEPRLNMSHVTLQRTVNGIPVYQGAVSVHMDGGNNVFRALGDEYFRVGAPTNRMMLSPAEAAEAAGKSLGVSFTATQATTEGQTTTFTAPNLLDPVKVEPRIFQVSAGDDRLAFQVLMSWLDDQQQQQYQLALVDAQDGTLLASHSLVNTFTGRVFNVDAQPTATQSADTRTVVSFDGDPTVSPSGWVGAARNTVGNNAVAATDLDASNTVGANETQPVADASDSFDFPYSGTVDASSFKAAAVANAFFLVNDWHDRTYKLGFTEAAGNFQTNNFGKGGAQNDAVNVDAQDGSGTNNANFATPPDGSRPRMQMFLFSIKNGAGGVRQDGDFDPSVIYHENTHGLSNRLVGGGSTNCLGGGQAGGMGEGWGDWLGSSFLNNPVVGAYVTGNATTGIRAASMASSPFTYGNIKDGSRSEVHDQGEVWAATLWDVRTAIGQAMAEQLVVSGMKLTPCNPTMLQARDAIIQADTNINGASSANHCKLWTAFAGRLMGFGASSPSSSSTSQIVTSTALPPECAGGGTGTTRTFTSTDVPKNIPDNNATGVRSNISVTPTGLTIQRVTVDVNITHTFRGDLVIQVIAPNGQVATLSNRQGGSADNFITTGLDITSAFTAGSAASGTWQLFVRDLARIDTGRINSFVLHITSPN